MNPLAVSSAARLSAVIARLVNDSMPSSSPISHARGARSSKPLSALGPSACSLQICSVCVSRIRKAQLDDGRTARALSVGQLLVDAVLQEMGEARFTGAAACLSH